MQAKAAEYCAGRGGNATVQARQTANLDRDYVRFRCIGISPTRESRGRESEADSSRQREAGQRIGTAFAVRSDGLLLTANHVVEGAMDIRVRCPGTRELLAEIHTNSPTLDLALLKVKGPGPYSYLSLAGTDSLQIGTRVFTVGFPVVSILGTDAKFTEGSISGLSGFRGDATLLQISVPLHAGNSGGALLNEQGQVVGVAIATASARSFLGATGNLPQNVNWAVKGPLAAKLFAAPLARHMPSDRVAMIAEVTKATWLLVVEIGSK